MNRDLTDDEYNTIVAIKENRFDEFWKERCGNKDFLSIGQKYSIISSLAVDTFDKTDWRLFREHTTRVMDYIITKKGMVFKKKKTLTLEQLLNAYISAFTCMRMVFPD